MPEPGRYPMLRVSLPSERLGIRALAGAAEQRLSRALDELSSEQRAWLARTPLDEGVVAVDRYKPRRDSMTLARPVAALETELLAAGGETWSGAYRRLLLLKLLSILPGRAPKERIPEIAWEGLEPALQLLLDGLDTVPGSSWADGDFRKDLAVAQLRVPLRAE